MTERKPREMSFTSWIDQQVADAEKRGLFDDLPGAGKPVDIRPEGGDYGQAWVRDYAAREGVPPEEFLPAPLRLRREIERLAETAGEMRSEAEVRDTVADLNRRIVEWRRIPVGPPVHVRLVDAEEMVGRWRQGRPRPRQATQGARPAPDAEPPQPQASQRRRPGRRRWWRRSGQSH
jgi:hypothetical protein